MQSGHVFQIYPMLFSVVFPCLHDTSLELFVLSSWWFACSIEVHTFLDASQTSLLYHWFLAVFVSNLDAQPPDRVSVFYWVQSFFVSLVMVQMVQLSFSFYWVQFLLSFCFRACFRQTFCRSLFSVWHWLNSVCRHQCPYHLKHYNLLCALY